METKQSVQELKAERVQEELMAEPVRGDMLFVDVADEPGWVSLKAERVQVPESLAAEGKAQLSSTLELTVSQKQPITIELQALGTVIKLHGAAADSGGQPQAA